MSTRPSLFRDMGHYLSGRALLIILGFATFPLMTRMLSVSQYGVLSLTLRIVLLLTVLSKCGLQYSAARFYDGNVAHGTADQQRRFYSTLVLGPFLTALAIISVYLPILLLMRGRLADPLLYRCLLLAPALVILRTLQSLLLSLLRNEGRSLLHSVLEVATKITTLAALLALVFGGVKSAFAILAATVASEGLIVLFQFVRLVRRKALAPHALDWGLIRMSLAFGAPLIAYELSSIILDSGDRLMVRHYLGDLSLGYYAAAYNISSYLQETLMMPLNLAIVPIYMRLWNDEGRAATQRFLSQSLSWFCVAAIEVTGLSILCSRDAIVLLASSRFVEAHLLLPILVPSLMVYSTHIFLNVGLILEKRTVLMATVVFCSAVVNILLNVVLIPRVGLMGAAWATLFSYVVLIALLWFFNLRILPLNVDVRLITKAAAAAAGAYIVAAEVHTRFSAETLVLRIVLNVTVFIVLLLLLSKTFRDIAAQISQHVLPQIKKEAHVVNMELIQPRRSAVILLPEQSEQVR